MKAYWIGALLIVGWSFDAETAVGHETPGPNAFPSVGIYATVQADDIGKIVIDEIERRLIRSFYQSEYDNWVHVHGKSNGKNKGKVKSMPPGLAKRGELPPGLAKQLVRNGTLPPGLQGRDLPPDLLRQLPPLHPNYRYVIADNKVMLIRRATNVILDILTVAAIDLLD